MTALDNRDAWNGVGSHPDFMAHTRPGYKPSEMGVALKSGETRDPALDTLADLAEQSERHHSELMTALARVIQLLEPKPAASIQSASPAAEKIADPAKT